MAGEVTHKEALALLGEAELAALKRTSNVPGLAHLAGHLAVLALTGWAVLALGGWLWPAALVVHGIVLTFLFTPLHESIHGTAFRSNWINIAVAEVSGFLLLLPPRYFRYFHFAHHRYTQDPARDPELATPRPRNAREYLWHLTGLPYWKAEALALANHALGRNVPPFVPRSGVRKLVLEARLHLLAYAAVAAVSVAAGSSLAVRLWIVPALLGQPFLRAYLLAEHGGCPLITDMLANTRTTFSNALVRALAWNMPHHTAHHALPTVPFHRLPRLTRLLEARLKCTAPGYVEAHRQIRQSWRSSAPLQAGDEPTM